MSRFNVDGRVGRLVVRGRGMVSDVAELVTGGGISLTSDGATQLTLELTDSDLAMLGSGLFDEGGSVDYAGLKFVTSALELGDGDGGPTLTVTARSLGWRKLKAARGALVRRRVSPTQFAYYEAHAAGLQFIGEPSAVRSQIARQTGDQAESSWDTIQRLAQELGFIAFEANGIVQFGRPTWLLANGGVSTWSVAWNVDPERRSPGLLKVPTCRRSEDDPRNAAEVTVELVGEDVDNARPGDVLVVSGVPRFSGRYLITGVEIPFDDTTPVTITAKTPVNPEPQPPDPPSTSSGKSKTSMSGSTATVEKFVGAALDQAGDNYVYGAEASASDPDPDSFDCSELVQWAAARAGVKGMVDGSANQLAYCKRKGTTISVDKAVRTRGALLFAPGHVAISLGNGRTIEAADRKYGVRQMPVTGRGFRWTAAALVPGLRYS